ncbi:general secretion pathway protein GspK [Brevundimonas sp.]|uniref:general secretion pathway protein GspK n=1 Tax=Brevundimonas sp. TaxID=1871086 RepID=UPI00272FCE4A|nr:type II secretion system protein GspK [Brevundimonas sp.]MDP1913752.1 type II secretion system protein GspK [Brevundimonas sp.]
MTGRRRRRADRRGMILLNVLIVVAIAAAAVTVMIVAQDIEVRRSIRLHDAAQAQAYARAGELSAAVALRRDALTTPMIDTVSEPWAQIGQQTIAIPGGSFALSIADEQARFNVNAVAKGDAISSFALVNIGEAAGVSRQTINFIAAAVLALGPLRDDGPLRTSGIDPAELDRLAPYIVFLPEDATLNINTADPALVGTILRDPAIVRRVLDRRRQGGLSPEDVAALGATGLIGAGSSHFRVETTVRVGDVVRRTSSRIERIATPLGPRVAVTARRRLPAG